MFLKPKEIISLVIFFCFGIFIIAIFIDQYFYPLGNLKKVFLEEEINRSDLIERNGKYYKKFSTHTYSSKVFHLDEDKNIRLESHLEDGVFHGEWTGYHKNGNLRLKKSYRHGIIHGQSTLYFDNRQLATDIHFNNGKIEGFSKAYHRNGKLSHSGNYIDGLKEGTHKYFAKNGAEIEAIQFKSDVIQDKVIIGYHPNKDHKSVTHLEGGIFEGDYITFWNKCFSHEAQFSFFFGEMSPNNLRDLASKGLCVKEVGSYKNGKLHGITIIYNRNGHLAAREEYKRGVSDGIKESYWSNGKLMQQGTMRNGRWIGKVYSYSRKGKLKKVESGSEINKRIRKILRDNKPALDALEAKPKY